MEQHQHGGILQGRQHTTSKTGAALMIGHNDMAGVT